jgi:hypothetical protein
MEIQEFVRLGILIARESASQLAEFLNFRDSETTQRRARIERCSIRMRRNDAAFHHPVVG